MHGGLRAALGVVALIVLAMPAIAEESRNIDQNVIIYGSEENPTYGKGDLLFAALSLANQGEARVILEIDNNCPIHTTIHALNGEQLWSDGLERGCGNSRNEIIEPGRVVSYNTPEFLFSTSNGIYNLPNGMLILRIELVGTQYADEIEFFHQADPKINDDFQLLFPDSQIEVFEGSTLVLPIGYNAQEDHPSNHDCTLRWELSSISSTNLNGLSEIPCTPKSDENSHLGWLEIDLMDKYGSKLNHGGYLLSVGIGQYWYHKEINILSRINEKNPMRLGLSLEVQSSANQFEVNLVNGAPWSYSIAMDDKQCDLEFVLIDLMATMQTIGFENEECPAPAKGRMELDIGESMKIASFHLNQDLFCHISESRQWFGLRLNSIELLHNLDIRDAFDDALCAFKGKEELLIVDSEIKWSNQRIGHVDWTLEVATKDSSRIEIDNCVIEIRSIGPNFIAPAKSIMTDCSTSFSSGNLDLNQITLAGIYDPEAIDSDKENPIFFAIELHAGFFEGETTSQLTTINQKEKIVRPPPVVEINEDLKARMILEGTWSHVRMEDGGCWTIESGPSTWALVEGDWWPSTGVDGRWLVKQSPSPSCLEGINSIEMLEVLEIYDNTEIILTSNKYGEEEVTVIDKFVQPTVLAPVAVSVSSIALLVGIKVESIRMTISRWGWLALVGAVSSKKPKDGTYQRGRIMGYLTANPGCHFRALLGALSMSNGQLSHHLRILENRGHIWRKKDGRKVRFYPHSIPENTAESDLPVPLLTPDPSSTQGQILDLLLGGTHDGALLSQRDLASRLDSSQQLISHHLRTLGEYGLIDRERRGVRYVYFLTIRGRILLKADVIDG